MPLMLIKYPVLVALTIITFATLGDFNPAQADEDRIEFNRDIRPILSDRCFACHGPDKDHREAELRLDMRDEAVESQAIVPGKPDHSKIIERIFSSDPEQLMPPAHTNKPLSAQQKDLLKRWVAQGAEYQGHWAYIAPVKPEIPAGVHPIDHLVGRHLAKKKLKPSAEAGTRTLIRRLYFDLLGLPPKVEDVELWEQKLKAESGKLNASDPNSAFSSLLSALLSSPHYGERMAIGWLDVVRFADTIGYHSDTPRNVWPYRDYVIDSFNKNKPFDRFTIEQLAGDLLPNATQEQKVGSCFNRLLLTTEEGGAQAKDYEARMLGDRVRAVGTVWLGQTIGCCQCHDHKYDPLTARDFYSMGAFFADVQEAAIGKREPGMLVTSATQEAELKRLQGLVDATQTNLDLASTEMAAEFKTWEQAMVAAATQADRWSLLQPTTAVGEQGTKLTVEKSGVVVAETRGAKPADTYVVKVTTKLKGVTALRLEALSSASIPGQGPGRAADGTFVISGISVTDAKDQPLKIAAALATSQTDQHPASAVLDPKSNKSGGWSTGPTFGCEDAIVLKLAEPLGDGNEQSFTIKLQQLRGGDQTLGRFRLSATTTELAATPAAVLPPDDVQAILKLESSKRTTAQQTKLSQQFRNASRATLPLRRQLAEAKQAFAKYEETVPRCLVSVAIKPRPVKLLPRGNWMDDTGPIMQAAFPGYLPQPKLEPGKEPTRLDLARWVVSRDNPLTARVFVNRVWKQFFGIGLSKAVDDLGSQGETPSHPELLDWLACDFIDSGWDVKHLVRTIVTSHTYRQLSTASKQEITRDPENRDLARQSRYRLDAELVRDNALAMSGLLSFKIGGPSVKPYQPDGYWENLNFPTRNYIADSGESQYRRGLYTWWQRSFLHPSMLAFDAPSREECAADRSRSNIPQQALVLLNDPTYVEAARTLGARIVREGGQKVDERIEWAWRHALSRPPRGDELDVARELVEKHQREFAADSASVDALLKVGTTPIPSELPKVELAAWTSLARVILNLHETITRN